MPVLKYVLQGVFEGISACQQDARIFVLTPMVTEISKRRDRAG